MERIFTAYMIEDPNGLKYFGRTKNIKHRWQPNHYKTTGLQVAIEKYGWKSLKKTIIADHLSEQDAKKIEAWMIERYDTMNPEKGYNRQHGDIYGRNKSHLRYYYNNREKSLNDMHLWLNRNKERRTEYNKKRWENIKKQKNTQQ